MSSAYWILRQFRKNRNEGGGEEKLLKFKICIYKLCNTKIAVQNETGLLVAGANIKTNLCSVFPFVVNFLKVESY